MGVSAEFQQSSIGLPGFGDTKYLVEAAFVEEKHFAKKRVIIRCNYNIQKGVNMINCSQHLKRCPKQTARRANG